MFKNLKWFILPLVAVLLTGWLLIQGQQELLTAQKITYTTKTTASTKNPSHTNDSEEISDVSMSDLIAAREQTTQLLEKYGIGQLIIPSQNINLPIYNLATNATLSTGVAKYYPDGPFLTGNTILAAHNFLDSPLLLYNAKNLVPNDKILITDYKNVYTFMVTSNQIVDQSETSVLEQTKNPTLTLIRCVGGIGTRKRLIIKADYVSRQNLTTPEKQSWSITSNTSPSVKKLSFVAQGLADSYRQHFLNWRLLLVIIVNILFIIIAIYFSLHQQNKNA